MSVPLASNDVYLRRLCLRRRIVEATAKPIRVCCRLEGKSSRATKCAFTLYICKGKYENGTIFEAVFREHGGAANRLTEHSLTPIANFQIE